MPKYVELPNGQYFPLKEGEDPTVALVEAQKLYPAIFGIEEKNPPAPKKSSGFLSDLAGSTENLLNIGRTGIAALTGDTTQAGQAGLERQNKIGERREFGLNPDKITDKWSQGDYGGAVGEAVRQIPSAVATLIPSAGQEMGLAAMGRVGGAAVGSLAGPGGAALGSQVGQYAVPFIVNTIQALGSEAQDKVAEQIKKGEKPDVSAAELIPYASANAALNLIGERIALPQVFKKAIGQKVAAETESAVRQKLLKEAAEIAGRGTLNAIARGAGHFVVGELPTEILQDVVDRAAIGQPLADDDAIKQYRTTAITMALGFPVGSAAALQERSGARTQIEAQDRIQKMQDIAEQQRLDAADRLQKEAYKQTPEYIQDLTDRWNSFDTQYKDLRQKAKTKVVDGDLIAQANKKEAQAKLTELMKDPNTHDLVQEYRAVKEKVDAQKAEEQRKKDLIEKQAAYDQRMQKPGAQMELFGAEELPPGQQQYDLFGNPITQEEKPNIPDADTYVGAHVHIAQRLAQITKDAAASKDENEIAKHAAEYEQLHAQQAELEKMRAQVEEQAGRALPRIEDFDYEQVDLDLQSQRKKLQKAQDEGDIAAIAKASTKIQELKQRASLFSTENKRGELEAKDAAERIKFTEEIEAKRKESEAQRLKIEKEIEDLNKIAEANKGKSSVEQAIHQKKLDDTKALRDLFKTGEQDWAKLRKKPEDIEYQQDRLDLKATLEKEIRQHERDARKKDEPLPSKNAFLAQQKQEALDNLNRRIELGQKYSKTTTEEEGPSNTQLLDQRVSDLIDTLLPGAIGEKTKEGQIVFSAERVAKREEQNKIIQNLKARQEELKQILPKIHAEIAQGLQRPAYESLVDEYKTNADHIEQLEALGKPRAVEGPGRELPIVAAQRELTRIKENEDILKELNDKIQKAGNPTDVKKRTALNLLQEQRDYVRSEIKDATDKYNRLATYEQKPGQAKEPEQQDLFGKFEETKAEYNPIKKQLDEAYKQRNQIKVDLNRRGRIATTPQMQELLDAYSKEPTGRLERISQEIEKLETEHERLTGKLSARHTAFALEREAEKQPTVRGPEQKQLPGFGLKQYTELKKPVLPEVMQAAKTKLVDLQSQMENFRKATGNVANPALQEKLQNRIDKAKAKLEDLELKQRMFEAQEDVIRGAFPGQREGEKLIAGAGYISAKGVARTKPTKLSSWGIKNAVRVKEAKPTELAKATQKVEHAKQILNDAKTESTSAADQARVVRIPAKNKLIDLNKNVDALLKEIDDNKFLYPEQTLGVLKEIYALQDFLIAHGAHERLANPDIILDRFNETISPLETARLYSQLQANVQNIDNMITPLAKKLDSLKDKYEDLHKHGYSKTVLQSYLDDLLNEALPVDKAHTAAVVKYAMARRDLLAFQYAASLKTTTAYKEAVAARDAEIEAQKNSPELQAASEKIKQVNAIQDEAEKNLNQSLAKLDLEKQKLKGEQLLKEKASEEEFKRNREAREGGLTPEQMAKAREGLGLPATRVETNTNTKLVDTARSNARKMLGMAQTQLAKARTEDDVDKVRKLEREVQRYEKALEQVQPLGERKVTKVEESLEPKQQKAEEGVRLKPRKEGPVVRTAARAPSSMLSGTVESRTPLGKRNQPTQAGVIRLRATDMEHEAANAVSLATLAKKIKATKDKDNKAKYQEAYDAATKGMTEAQIKERLKEGDRLLASGPTLTIIAAKEKYRAANEAFKKAAKNLTTVENAATKEFPNKAAIALAQQEYELAEHAVDNAENALDKALDDHENKVLNKRESTAVREADNAVEEDISVEIPAKEFGEDVPGRIIPGEGDLFASGREAPGTVLSDEAMGNLLDGNLVKTLEHIGKDIEGFLGENAKAVMPFIWRTKVVIVPKIVFKGKEHPALYEPETNTVYFTPQGFTAEDVVHEATHAATMRVLSLPNKDLTPAQIQARNELQAMYNKSNSDPKFKEQYGIKNLKEFVSEVQSNSDFRNLLDKKPWYKDNMFIRAVQAILRLVGVKPSLTESAKAQELIRSIFTQSKVLKNVESAPAKTYSSALVGSTPDKWDTFRGNFLGLAGRVQFVDKLAAVDNAIIAAEGKDKLTSLEAFNTQYFMRLGDQVSTAAGQFLLHGPMKIVSEKTTYGKEYRYESQKGANILNLSNHINTLAKVLNVKPEEAERMVTVLIAGERANSMTNGWERLMAQDTAKVKAEHDKDIQTLKLNPKANAVYEAAKKEYKEYNDGQLDFAVDCDFLSKEEAERLKRTPYIPFYRIVNGAVKLYTDREHAITIGNIKDNPDLQRMIGDNNHILPVLTSAVQNTFMLTRMSLQNKAAVETSNALHKAGFASRIGMGTGPSGIDVVHYKLKGKNAFAVIDTDTFGIPAHLIVKGMEGIKTTIPAIVQAMGVPAQWIRKFVTRFPAYGVRQLIRDPVNSFILSGVDGVPMVNALKELGKMHMGKSRAEEDLMRGLAISSNVFSGDERDMTKFLEDITSGRSGWQTFLGKLDRFALQADTATKATIYEDSLKKGLSKAQAQFRAFESQNLSRRGLSPSMQMLNTMIPFFNSQIQGLDVLYRSLTNKMPFAEQMDLRRKIIARSTMLMGVSLAYAMMMQDDDAYRKARPEERYGNFFVYLPFTKDPLKIPIPYEIGILFKAIPEAIIDFMHDEMSAYEGARGMGKLILQNAIPGGLPAAIKPFIEASYGATEYGPIESQREKELMATDRYRPETTEVTKLVGKLTGKVGVSPILLEHFIRGYTGSLGLAALHMVDPLLYSGAEGQKPTLPASKTPFISGMFQPAEGRYLIERAYERMNDVLQAQRTYQDKLKKGQRAEADSFRQNYANLISSEGAAGQFRKNMGDLFSRRRAIEANPNISQVEKDKKIEALVQQENVMARRFTSLVDRKELQ
jgi:hypothetical protein